METPPPSDKGYFAGGGGFRVTFTQEWLYEGYVYSGNIILGLRIIKNEYMRGTYTLEVDFKITYTQEWIYEGSEV